jgi:uncharacterized glyoxalase superfamily protein PhnB
MSEMARQSMFPALRYRDPDKAIAWLADAFGFSEHEIYRDDEGVVRHAVLRLGSGLVLLGPFTEGGWLGGRPGDALASTVSLYVVVDDPDTLFNRASAAGATVVRELQDTDYGSREFSIRDPEGHLWSFGTYDPWAPAK